MKKYKLKRGQKIGALSAEHDRLLESAFIDLGYIEQLLDVEDPYFLVVGRTGSGKTALIEQIKRSVDFKAVIDPDELSMQYLQGSTILKVLLGLGVNLDIFFKYLWRHVCVLELIHLRYPNESDIPGKLSSLLSLIGPRAKQRQTEQIAQRYSQEYAGEYWERVDTKIRKITTEMENSLKKDESVSAFINKKVAGFTANVARSKSEREAEKEETELVSKAQDIVSNYQIADLNNLVSALAANAFSDPQKQYYILIDDLDKDWMPDDALYVNLIRSLLFTVKDLNKKLPNVKIIVALRENIYYRVFQFSSRHDPQREKWADVRLSIRWKKSELIEMIDERLRAIFREQYSSEPPTMRKILPGKQKKQEQDAVDYIIDRSLRRPRDVIEYMNLIIEDQTAFNQFTWENVLSTEKRYSQKRREALIDEWEDGFPGLPLTFPFLKKAGVEFQFDDLTEDDLIDIFASTSDETGWFKKIGDQYINGDKDIIDVRLEILGALYLVGLIGVKEQHGSDILYSTDRAYSLARHNAEGSTFQIHKMFWSALGINPKARRDKEAS